MSDNNNVDSSKVEIGMDGKDSPEVSSFDFKIDLVNDDIGRNIPYQILHPIPNPIDFIESNHNIEFGATKVTLPLPLPQLNDENIRVSPMKPILLASKDDQITNGDNKLKTLKKSNHRNLTVNDKINKGVLPNTGDFKIKSEIPCDIQINYSIRNLINAQYDGEGEVFKLSQLFHEDTASRTLNSIREIEGKFWQNLKTPVSKPITCFSTSLIQPPTLDDKIRKFLHPWNLRNIPLLPGSLSSNGSMKFNIGRTNDIQNWSIVENFGQSIKYQISGWKKWYIIPESEYDKFWNLVNLETVVKSEADLTIRLRHSNSLFQSLIQDTIDQDFIITPALLDTHGIKYHTSIQSPGDYLITYPKTTMLGISLTFNVEQEVDVFTSLWSKYALDFVNNERTHNEVFRIVLLSIQNGCDNLSELYNELLIRELDTRSKVRELGIKELVNDNLSKISDDNLQYLYPSQILITDTTTSQKFQLSIESFLKLDINSSNYDRMKFELLVTYNDEKLKSFLKLSNNLNDYNKWIDNYEKMMESSDHSLKTYKALYSDGEKIFNSLTSVKIFDHFQDALGIQRSKDDDKWLRFLNYLDNLQKFIMSSTKFIDDCQSILSLKHHQRIRGSGTNAVNIMNGFPDETTNKADDDALSDPDVVLPKLSHLVSIVPKLNFNCSEIDLIIEFLNEIENFERSVRLLLLKENPSINEFNELINLGKSFGINLISLKFIIRVRNKLIWCKNYDIIINGNEPTNQENKKEIFDLPNLKHFYNQGIEILSFNDSDKLKVIKKIIDNSENFNKKINEFLEIKIVNEAIIKDLDLLIDEIEDRYKLDNDERIFAQLSRYDLLLDLRQMCEVFEKFFDFKNGGKLSFEELTKLKKSLLDTKLSNKEDIQYIDNLIDVTKSSIDSIRGFFQIELDDKKKENSVIQLIDMILLSMSSMDNDDSYEKSSSKAFIDGNESTDPRQIYCVCRNFELGTMIECESCKEWYHDSCVNKPKEAVEPDTETKKPRKRRKKVDKDDANKEEVIKMEVDTDPVTESLNEPAIVNNSAPKAPESGSGVNTIVNKSEQKSKPQPKSRSKDKKKRELTEEEDIFVCPVCRLIESPDFVDEKLSKNPTLLDLVALIQSLRTLNVQPAQELAKLVELQDKLLLLSQGYVRKISNIKSGDYNLNQKLDRLRFILRKLYGYSINIEDLFWECLTSIRRMEFEKHWREKELKSKTRPIQDQDQNFPPEPTVMNSIEVDENGTKNTEINDLIDTELLNLTKEEDSFETDSLLTHPVDDKANVNGNVDGVKPRMHDTSMQDQNVQKTNYDDSIDSTDLNGLESQYTHLPDYTYEAPSLTPSALSPSVTENGISGIDSKIDAALEDSALEETATDDRMQTDESNNVQQIPVANGVHDSAPEAIQEKFASPKKDLTKIPAESDRSHDTNPLTSDGASFETSSLQDLDSQPATVAVAGGSENPTLPVNENLPLTETKESFTGDVKHLDLQYSSTSQDETTVAKAEVPSIEPLVPSVTIIEPAVPRDETGVPVSGSKVPVSGSEEPAVEPEIPDPLLNNEKVPHIESKTNGEFTNSHEKLEAQSTLNNEIKDEESSTANKEPKKDMPLNQSSL